MPCRTGEEEDTRSKWKLFAQVRALRLLSPRRFGFEQIGQKRFAVMQRIVDSASTRTQSAGKFQFGVYSATLKQIIPDVLYQKPDEAMWKKLCENRQDMSEHDLPGSLNTSDVL